MSSVLNILKQSCCGLSREEFLEKARVEGIARPLEELKELVNQGLVRIDQSPPPARFKATSMAFQQK
jgi:hypothetical protein